MAIVEQKINVSPQSRSSYGNWSLVSLDIMLINGEKSQSQIPTIYSLIFNNQPGIYVLYTRYF